MANRLSSHLCLKILALSSVAALVASCGGSKNTTVQSPESARSALFSIDMISLKSAENLVIRSSSLLGVFLSEYLSDAGINQTVQGAIDAVGINSTLMVGQSTITDPDFELLQAFADALQVDVSDLLNRSESREETLTTYTEALTNVATRANERFKQLESAYEELREVARTQNKERGDAERELNTAIKDKDFSSAGELQKVVAEKQAAYAETDLKMEQTEDLLDTLDSLLVLYGEKILAIQRNREALISGLKVVDVPGAEDLKVLERERTRAPRRDRDNGFDGLFDGLEQL